MGQRHKIESSPAQRDSEISILKTSPYRPCRPLDFKNSPAQQDSEMSILKTKLSQQHSEMSNLGVGLIGPMGPIGLMGKKPAMKNRPAQRDSGNSILAVGVLRILGILGWKTKSKSRPAQRDSGIYKLEIRPFCPSCPLVLKTTPVQRGSRMSKLGLPEIFSSILLKIFVFKFKKQSSALYLEGIII